MKTRHWLAVLAATVLAQADVQGLTPPSASDGPVRLLTCIVTSGGILEAHVDNQSDDAMDCHIRCNYELGGRMFSHDFNLTIPKRYHGRVGRFDTSNARAGNYPGDMGSCKKGFGRRALSESSVSPYPAHGRLPRAHGPRKHPQG